MTNERERIMTSDKEFISEWLSQEWSEKEFQELSDMKTHVNLMIFWESFLFLSRVSNSGGVQRCKEVRKRSRKLTRVTNKGKLSHPEGRKTTGATRFLRF